tara:strand:- start:3834 stop:3974 length:141 start_codon:yes stop_codon:yes gene_type:complete
MWVGRMNDFLSTNPISRNPKDSETILDGVGFFSRAASASKKSLGII